jgi:hypothetical protein
MDEAKTRRLVEYSPAKISARPQQSARQTQGPPDHLADRLGISAITETHHRVRDPEWFPKFWRQTPMLPNVDDAVVDATAVELA